MQPPCANVVPALQLLDVHQVCALLGCHRITLGRWIRAGRFPPPLRLSPRILRWRLDVVRAFLEQTANPAEGQSSTTSLHGRPCWPACATFVVLQR